MTLHITGNNMNSSPELSLSGGTSTAFAWSPFGGVAGRSGNTTSLPGFNGEREDPLSGVTHLGNGYRAYSPALRRFTCPDSESPFGEGGINPYVYCNHDPVNNTDPSGHAPPRLTKALLAEAKAEFARNSGKKVTDSLASSVANSNSRTAGTRSARQGTSGVANIVTQHRANPSPPVQVTQLKASEYEMAPAYAWAVDSNSIQNASSKKFHAGTAITTIEEKMLDRKDLKRENPALKDGLKALKNTSEREVSDKLNALIHKYGSPRSKSRPLYRGIKRSTLGNEIRLGSIIEENRFTATSESSAIAEKFAKRYVQDPKDGLVVKVLGGRPLAIPNVYAGMSGPGENEYLYARDTKFRLSQDPVTNQYIFTALK